MVISLRSLVSAGVVAGAIAFAAGCGGGSTMDEPPPSGSSPPAGGAAGDAGGPGFYGAPDRMLKLAGCLRDRGFDVADPDARGRMVIPDAVANAPGFRDAQAACSRKLGSGGTAPGSAAAGTEAALRFARCMRSHGVNVPDPDPNAPGIAIGGPGMNPNDPKVQEAVQACQKLLPRNATF
jgi:hypothetical protein